LTSRKCVGVIINPISGTGGRPAVARQRAELAASLIAASGAEPRVFVTERPGHARELAERLLAQGTNVIAAWGGDGTVNEVASTLAFTGVPLAIVPSGSGNGLARELRIPFEPHAAFDVVLGGRDRVMDAGELDGHLFFNVAGIGLDARIAHRFAANGLLRRGFRRYLEIGFDELRSYTPDAHTIAIDGDVIRERTLLIAVANARQYGNGALIAPNASIDDGRLDVVIVTARPLLLALLQVPLVFMGKIESVRGVTVRRAVDVEITSAQPVVYHVDGEPFLGAASLRATVRPQALTVRVPAAAGRSR
jgi:YegS/Rv2252/BmrU family lipid kinase